MAKLLQPLNHDLIPNLVKNVWPVYQNPFYDQHWRYTVPYVTWTTGVGYRRDHIDDDEVAEKGYNILWDPQYKGKVSIYDDYRDGAGHGAAEERHLRHQHRQRRGPEARGRRPRPAARRHERARVDQRQLLGVPRRRRDCPQAWSGDMVGDQYYLPKGVPTSVLGYWYPKKRNGEVNNDTMVIPTSSQHPVAAHTFIDFMLDKKYAFENFADWVGYQPPQNSINPSELIADGVVPQDDPAGRRLAGRLQEGHLSLS